MILQNTVMNTILIKLHNNKSTGLLMCLIRPKRLENHGLGFGVGLTPESPSIMNPAPTTTIPINWPQNLGGGGVMFVLQNILRVAPAVVR